MFLYGLDEIVGATVVEKKDALTQSPQRGTSKLVPRRQPLRYPVIELCSHLVKRQIRVETHRLVSQCGHRADGGCSQFGRVARRASDPLEKRGAAADGIRTARCVWGWLRGARKRMKAANFSTSLSASRRLVVSALNRFSGRLVSFGTV